MVFGLEIKGNDNSNTPNDKYELDELVIYLIKGDIYPIKGDVGIQIMSTS